MIGIYKIQNKINGKMYIGQSIHIKQRWKEHKYELNNNLHQNKHLQSAWNKYKSKNFEFKVLCECEELELDENEIYYIELYKSYDENYGYNLTIGGDGNRKYYNIDLIANTFNETNSIRETSKILDVSEYKISNILNDLNIRNIKNPNREIVGLDKNDYTLKFQFKSMQDAYKYFNSSITNQINEYSCAVTPQVRQTGNRLSGLAETAYANLLA